MRLSQFDESDFNARASRDSERAESCSQGSNGKVPGAESPSIKVRLSEETETPSGDTAVTSHSKTNGSSPAAKFRWDEPPPPTVVKRTKPIEASDSSNELESDHIFSTPPANQTGLSGSNVLLAGNEPVDSPTELRAGPPANQPLALEADPLANPDTSDSKASDSVHSASGNGHTVDKAAVARELAAALSSRNQGDYVRAIASLTAALRLDPNCAEAYAHRGAALRLMGDYSRAIADCSAAIAADRNLVLAYETRGAVYRTTGETAKAVADFSEVIRLDPKNTLAFSQRGNALGELGESGLAIEDYTAAIKLDPRSLWSWQSRGLAYAATGAHMLAVSDFTEVLRLDSRSVLALYQRGDARLRLGQHEQSIADFTAALELEPKHALALARRAQAHHAQGNLEQALADYNAALEIEPGHVENLHSRGLIHRLRGDLDLALADLNQVLTLDPNHQATANNRGNLHFARGDYDQAISDYSVAVRLDPQFARGYANRGNVYFTRGDWEQSVADYTEAVRSDPKFARAFMNRGLALARLGRYQEVIADCTEAIKLDPELAPPYYYRGHAYAKLRQYDAALLDFNQSLLRDPRDYLSYIDRGLLYAKLKEYERAIDDYTSALQLEPRNALIYANRAIAHRKLDEHTQALSDTARAAGLDPKYALSYISQQARTHAAAGDYRRALADFTVALAIDPNNAELKRERELAAKAAGPIEVDSQEPYVSSEAEADSEAASESATARKGDITPEDIENEFLLEEIPSGDSKSASETKKTSDSTSAIDLNDLGLSADDAFAEFLLETPVKKKSATAAPVKPVAAKPTSKPSAKPEPEVAPVVSLKKKGKTPLGSQIWDAKELGALVREGIKNTPEGNRPAVTPSRNAAAPSGVNLAKKEVAKKAPQDRMADIESLLFDEAPVSSMARTTPPETRLPGTSIRTKTQTQILKKPVTVEAEAKKPEPAAQALVAKVEPLAAKVEPAPAPSPAAEKPAEDSSPATIPFPSKASPFSGRLAKRSLTGVAVFVFLLSAGYLLSEFALGSGDYSGGNNALPIAATLSTKEFCKEYLNDNKTANVKFAGKILKVRGKVQEVVTDKNPRLVFVPDNGASWAVECMFGHPTGLSGVSVDNEVVILGECQLRTKPDGNVQLYNCQIKSGI